VFVHAGQNASFSVGVIGTPPAYRWRKDGALLSDGTAMSLLRTNVQWPDHGNYDVVVTNGYGAVTSQVAVLTVNAAPADAFNPASGSAQVFAMAPQADGGLLVGGHLPSTGSTPPNFLVRVNGQGVADNGFDPNADYYVRSLCLQPDGKILIGGGFTLVDGQVRERLARLTQTGSIDTNFNPGSIGSGDVYSLVPQPDGRILVGGSYVTIAGQYRAGLSRVYSNGTLDTPFDPQPFGGPVWAMALQPDGKIIVGGYFIQLGGQSRIGIGRINNDGTLDQAFNPQLVPPPGRGGAASSLVLQPDRKILVGGVFNSLAGHNTSFIGRLNTNGTADTTFTVSVAGGSYPEVFSLALQADGKIVLGGTFTSVNGQIRSNLARLNPDGSLDDMFIPQAAGTVCAVALQPDGNVLVGGMFNAVGGQSRSSLARLTNTVPATQSLNYNSNTITWLRGGSSPEVWRTTFETSTNGLQWIGLGEGTRIPGGWQLANVFGLTNLTVRARGDVIGGGGFYSGSSWFVESMLIIAPRTRPTILVHDSSFGVQSNRFGFKVSAFPGQVVVTEVSTNLQVWTPLAMDWVHSNSFYFLDTRQLLHPSSFYRVRLY
ncbi:MAG TPA: hypothetical protein VFZ59_19630, partial [Verrucomicrobiae bacterium]|nr:hypothetical protein [Verrucomicrobiae bacterium]